MLCIHHGCTTVNWLRDLNYYTISKTSVVEVGTFIFLCCVNVLYLTVITYSSMKHCKVAGINLTCRDDSKIRWAATSVDPTSTELSSPSQDIHLPVARIVYGL